MIASLPLDDELLEKAFSFTGAIGTTDLIREALKALIQRESAKRLALLGGSEPQLVCAHRRREKPQ